MDFDSSVLEARAEELGEMDVGSGRLLVCDAGTLFGPVALELAPGSYVVRIHVGDHGDNVAAVLTSKTASASAWEDVGSYAVDAGMAGMFDGALFDEIEKHRFPISIYDDLICNHLDPAEREGHAGAFVPFGSSKFAACRSGGGDGVYAVFAGRDASGRVVAVATLF